jgi:hypothetical protein
VIAPSFREGTAVLLGARCPECGARFFLTSGRDVGMCGRCSVSLEQEPTESGRWVAVAPGPAPAGDILPVRGGAEDSQNLAAGAFVIDLELRVVRHREHGLRVDLPELIWPILDALLQHGPASSTELRARVGRAVSAETIRSTIRSMKALLDLKENELVVSTIGRRGGYRIARNR